MVSKIQDTIVVKQGQETEHRTIIFNRLPAIKVLRRRLKQKKRAQRSMGVGLAGVENA